MEIASIGALLGLANALVSGIGNLGKAVDSGGFLKKSKGKEELQELATAFSEYQERLQYLADQLEYSETLSRIVPGWIGRANTMPFWEDVTGMDDSAVTGVHQEVHLLINDSVNQNFSSTFFSKDFDKLPGMEAKLTVFRSKLSDLDSTLSTITPGNVLGFRGQWHTLATQFNDAINAAKDVENDSREIHGRFIKELKDAAEKKVADVT